MNKYITWGSVFTVNNDTSLVFINGFGEFVGMFIFILFLVGILLNFNLKKSKGYSQNSYGWIILAISFGLTSALFASLGIQMGMMKNILHIDDFSLLCSMSSLSLNPIYVISGMIKGFNYSFTSYIPILNGLVILIFEFLGAFLGALFAYLFFRDLIKHEEWNENMRSYFFTVPSVYNLKKNYANEFLATFVLSITLVGFGFIFNADQLWIQLLLVGLIVGSIGYGLGGTTGYALNPFRDLGPRICYYIFFKKQDLNLNSTWKYAQVPIIAPILASILSIIVMPGFLY